MLNFLGEIITSVLDCNYNKTNLESLEVGQTLGTCKNCNSLIKVRQPWLSKEPIVNDGIYLVHCENTDCHNNSGYTVTVNTLFMIDNMVNYEEKYLNQEEKISNIISFKDFKLRKATI